MLSKYTKSDVPSWQRKLVLILGSLFGATVLLFAVWAVMLLADRARIDHCLDEGGRHDDERGECVIEDDYRPG